MRPNGLSVSDRAKVLLAIDRLSALNGLDDLWSWAVEEGDLLPGDRRGLPRISYYLVRRLDRLPQTCRDIAAVLSPCAESIDAQMSKIAADGFSEPLRELSAAGPASRVIEALVLHLAHRASDAAFEIHKQRSLLKDFGPSGGLLDDVKSALVVAIGMLRVFAGLPEAGYELAVTVAGADGYWREIVASSSASANDANGVAPAPAASDTGATNGNAKRARPESEIEELAEAAETRGF